MSSNSSSRSNPISSGTNALSNKSGTSAATYNRDEPDQGTTSYTRKEIEWLDGLKQAQREERQDHADWDDGKEAGNSSPSHSS